MSDGPTSEKSPQLTSEQQQASVAPRAPEPSKNFKQTEVVESQRQPNRILVTEAELHYKSLTDYFKYLVTVTLAAIGILVTVGLYVTYKDVSAMRAEVRQNVLDAKAEIRQNMSDVKSDTKAAVDSTREDARISIENATNTANSQISQIRERAGVIALGEAQRRVDEAFRSTNVQTLVEDAARRQVGPVIERNVAEQVDRVMSSLQEDISLSSRIADAGNQMRSGMQSGLNELISLQKTAPSERSRKNAKMILDNIADSYEYYRQRDLHAHPSGPGNAIDFLDEGQAIKKGPSVAAGLIKLIRTSEDLSQVALAFIALREATGHRFRMFDIDAVDKWCVDHAAECKK
jgi:hypothetical protein